MRRNNTRSETKKTDEKEDPPLLLAGKREKPTEADKCTPRKCVDHLWSLLIVLLVGAFCVSFINTAIEFRDLVLPSPMPTADDYSVAAQLLRARFDKLKAKMPVGDQDSFRNELDQLDREVAFVARVEGELQQAFEQVRGKLRNLEEGTVTV